MDTTIDSLFLGLIKQHARPADNHNKGLRELHEIAHTISIAHTHQFSARNKTLRLMPKNRFLAGLGFGQQWHILSEATALLMAAAAVEQMTLP